MQKHQKRHYANQIFLSPKSHLWQCIIYNRISKGLVKRQLEWQYKASWYQIMGYPPKRMYNELFNFQLFYQNCWDHARDRNYYILIINKYSEFIFKIFSLNFLTGLKNAFHWKKMISCISCRLVSKFLTWSFRQQQQQLIINQLFPRNPVYEITWQYMSVASHQNS